MQRAHRPGLHLRNAHPHRLAHHPVEAEGEEVLRVAVVRADADPLGGCTVLHHRADGLGQAVPGRGRRTATQVDPDARFQEVVGDVAVDGLVRIGDAAGRVGGHEVAPVDVARDRAAALQGGPDDGVGAGIALADRDEVHLLAEADRLRPGIEQGRDLDGVEIAARGLQFGRGRRHGAGHREVDVEGRRAGILQHPGDAVAVEHVADLVAVADDGGGAVEERGLGVRAGRDHAALDVQVRVHEPRREEAAGEVLARRAAPVGARRLDRGDPAARDPDLAIGQDALRVRREQACPGKDAVGLRPARGHRREVARHAAQGFDGKARQRSRVGHAISGGGPCRRACIVPEASRAGQRPHAACQRRRPAPSKHHAGRDSRRSIGDGHDAGPG
ncbi:hypothetical protein CFIICLFH_4698 [Methylobacterium goesingense]|nr:hypothetical protein CFIICLFH_4698 [Methylobacterium goesingense]